VASVWLAVGKGQYAKSINSFGPQTFCSNQGGIGGGEMTRPYVVLVCFRGTSCTSSSEIWPSI
jgi:hypothetical protein